MDEQRIHKIRNLLLRSLPILPGPELFDLVVDLGKSRTELDKKVTEAVNSMRNASALVSELEASLADRTAKLTELRNEIDRLSQVASLEEAKAAPLLRELTLLTRKGRGKERVIAFVINIIAGALIFLAGAYLGPKLFPHQ